jgi:branched-subunit amino acid aminotransferase/4-amino-4-deoxychorismate lyase
MLHYRQAAIEARKKDGDDALMLTTDGFVAETSIANIFWKKGDTVYTPSTDCDILPGITRSLIIQLVKELGYSVNEGQFRPNELVTADTAWICNSIREIVWIKSIDDQKFSEDRDFQDELVSRFERYKTQHTA